MQHKFANIHMIAFDLFGVLITEGHMVSNSLMPLLTKSIDKQTVKSFYNPYTRGEISEQDFWSGIGQENNPQLHEKFLNSFVLADDFTSTIQTLSATYQLSILSNLGSAWAKKLNHKFHFTTSFNPIIISGDVGYEKPQPQIYHRLIQQSQLQAQAIVFIDDRLENLKAAHQLGMKTIHFKHEADTSSFQADACIHQLSELIDLL